MARTIVGLFDINEQARNAVQELLALGVARDDISLIARDVDGEYARETGASLEEGAAEGATSGAIGGGVLGGLLGLLLGAGVLAIPGVGPLVLAGPLAAAIGSAAASTLVGAGVGVVSGGLLGALVGAGIPEEEAGYYLEGVQRGGILVSATVDDTLADRAYASLLRHGAVNMDERVASWRNEDRQDDPDASERPTGPLPAAPTPTTPHDSEANETVAYESPAQREQEYGAAAGTPQRKVAPDPNAPAGDTWQESDKTGTASGTAAGAAGGAAIGAAGGVVGAVVGGVAGAAIGAGAGAAGDIAAEEDTSTEQRRQDEELRREEDRY